MNPPRFAPGQTIIGKDVVALPVRIGDDIARVHPLVTVEKRVLLLEEIQRGLITVVGKIRFLDRIPLIGENIERRFKQFFRRWLSGAGCVEPERMDADIQRGKLRQRIERNALARQRIVQRVGVDHVGGIKRDLLYIGIARVFAIGAVDLQRDGRERIIGLHLSAQFVAATKGNAAARRGKRIVRALVKRQYGR